MGYGFLYPRLRNGSATTVRLPRLRPNTTYRLTVWAFTSAGSGVDNFIDVTTAPSDVAPTPPNFVISTLSTTNFTVLFEPSHTGIPGTVFYVQYRQPGIIHWLDSPPTFSDRTITVTSLSPDTSYQVRMVATNGGQLSATTADRLIHTLGGPGPDSLAGSSGTWFIIVCVLLILFILILVLLVFVRRQRLSTVRKRATEPAEPLMPTVPGSLQPASEEARSLLSPSSNNEDASEPSDQNRLPANTRPIDYGDYDDDLLASETEEFSGAEPTRLVESQQFTRHSYERWDNDADLVSGQPQPETPLRSNEEEAELELDHSYNVRRGQLASQAQSAYPRSRPRDLEVSARDRNFSTARRPPSPRDSSQASQISGDPTII